MSDNGRSIDIDAMMADMRRQLTPAAPPSCDGGLGIDELMVRLQTELKRRGHDHVSDDGTAAHHGTLLERWRPAIPRLPAKGEYALSELLAFSDVDFIENAYRAVLRRLADDNGYRFYLDQLRSGAMSKIEVLAALRWSAEGESRGVHVDGLLAPYLLQKWSRRKLIGPCVRLAHSILRLPRLFQHVMALDAAQARESQELGAVLNRISAQVEEQFESMRAEAAEGDRRIEIVIHELMARLKTAEAELQLIAGRSDASHSLDELYASFEDKFRGEQELVRARVMPYLSLVREAQAGSPQAPIIDLGAGRGEWIELLGEQGLSARGVDTNRVFLDACRERGLDVVESDAIEALIAMPDASAGAITAMHLVEHLPFEKVIQLIDEAQRVLKEGGVLILETPNPENLQVASHWFYLDPTHRNPLPPVALEWLVGARGFKDVRVDRLFEARDIPAPGLLPVDLPGAHSLNVVLENYRAAPDYAVIGWRK